MSTENVDLLISGALCRAARALLDMTQPALAKASGVGLSTVVDFEKGRRHVAGETVHLIQRALEGAGVEFTHDGEPGVRMRSGESNLLPSSLSVPLGLMADPELLRALADALETGDVERATQLVLEIGASKQK